MGIQIKSVLSQDGKVFNESLKKALTTSAKVGWFGKYPADENGNSAYVGAVAIQNEFGDPSKRIPARPFLRPTLDEKKSTWLNLLSAQVKRVLQGKLEMEDALLTVGEVAKGDIQKTISSIWEPPLSPYTIAMRLKKRGISSKSNNSLNGSDALTKSKIKKSIAGGDNISLLEKPLIDTGIFFNTITTEIEK